MAINENGKRHAGQGGAGRGPPRADTPGARKNAAPFPFTTRRRGCCSVPAALSDLLQCMAEPVFPAAL
jgi:hypothetical protein